MPSPTPQQQAAIAASGDVLVMAGAGAGKTSTLVARVLDRVLRGTPRVSLDRLLVVTFTEAAASEMRHRIGMALELEVAARAVALDGRNGDAEAAAWAHDQLALLETARVSTLHAFCLRLVREHFHELALDPQFAVQDSAQAAILRQQVLDGILREAYADETEGGEPLRTFLRRHAAEGDRSLRTLILRIHDHARSLPDPAAWLTCQRVLHENPEPVAWREGLIDALADWTAAWRVAVEEALERDAANVFAQRARPALEALAARVANREEMDVLRSALAEVVGAGSTEGLKKGRLSVWKKPLKALFDEAAEVKSLITSDAGAAVDPLSEDWVLARADVLALLVLVERFTARVAAARRAAAVVDFADLEQFALALLWNSSTQAPSALARTWRDRLEHVLVDEYQDINGAQDRLIACLSRDGERANRFFVGDVKQSIYRFRRADPRIFQSYAFAWREGAHRRVIPLVENFRSHGRILDFVNAWFPALMREAVGGVAYDEEARLVFGAPEARSALRADPDGRVEVLLLTQPGAGDAGPEEDSIESDDLDREEMQAAAAAARLKAWHDAGLQVSDAATGGRRPVTWRDMVVLHPSPRPVAERWARQFARHGVPLEARRAGFYEALEVADLVNLARLLDNPVQDHALLAVLRSPLVGMTVDELAVVRLADRRAPLWDALVRCARGDGLRGTGIGEDAAWRAIVAGACARAAEFLDSYRRWRRLAREGALSLCLERALAETAFEAWLRAQPRAASRLANVQRLLALTRQFDQFLRHGLFRFLQFLDAQREVDEDAESAPVAASDSVRLMSVHQSKGLEFPVVLVAGLGRRFNVADVRADWLIDPVAGIAPPVLGAAADRSHPSVARWAAVRRLRREMAGEQVRLLYVACTRAIERLVLMGEVTASQLEGWAEAGAAPLGDRDLVTASSPIHWLGRCLASLTGQADWAGQPEGRGTWVDWRRVEAGLSLDAESESESESESGSVAEPAGPGADDAAIPDEIVRLLADRLSWRYPWPGAVAEAGKVAVTTLAKRYVSDEEATAWPELDSWRAPASERSAASSEEAVARGAAHHLFCERLNLGRSATQVELEMELDRMETEGLLTSEQKALLDLPALAGFWGSALGDRLRASAAFVERELPFTTRLSAAEFERLGGQAAVGSSPEDFQVVQGVVDLAVILEKEIWIVDFKTDRVTGAALDERIDKYRLQLRLYAHALSGIYGRPVTACWLWFFHPRRLVAVEV